MNARRIHRSPNNCDRVSTREVLQETFLACGLRLSSATVHHIQSVNVIITNQTVLRRSHLSVKGRAAAAELVTSHPQQRVICRHQRSRLPCARFRPLKIDYHQFHAARIEKHVSRLCVPVQDFEQMDCCECLFRQFREPCSVFHVGWRR